MPEEPPEYLGQAVEHRNRILKEGFAQIGHYIIRSPCLSPNEKTLLFILISHAGRQAGAWPSMRVLSEEMAVTEPTVKGALRGLVGKGLVTVQPRLRDDGSQASNLYIVEDDAILLYIVGYNPSPPPENIDRRGDNIPTPPRGKKTAPLEEEPYMKDNQGSITNPSSSSSTQPQVSERPQILAKAEFAVTLIRLYQDYYPTVKPPGPGITRTFRRAASDLALPLAREPEIMEYCFQQAALGLKPPRYALGILKSLAAEGWPDLSERGKQHGDNGQPRRLQAARAGPTLNGRPVGPGTDGRYPVGTDFHDGTKQGKYGRFY